jgi:hypothetical protein
VDILPLFAPSKMVRYGKQIKFPDPFRLLLLEKSHGGEVLKNQEGFLGRKGGLKSLVDSEVVVQKWSNCLMTPLKHLPSYIKIPQ